MISPSKNLAALFILAASVLAIGVALVAQYGFHLHPCELCLAQRGPVALAAILVVVGFWPKVSPGASLRLVWVAAILYAGNAGLAFFHVGVEQHWWLLSTCSGVDGQVDVGAADFLASLNQPVVVRCDQPAWIWHGITMAFLNIFYSAGVAAVALWLLIKGRQNV